jgi:hypothetical protein
MGSHGRVVYKTSSWVVRLVARRFVATSCIPRALCALLVRLAWLVIWIYGNYADVAGNLGRLKVVDAQVLR